MGRSFNPVFRQGTCIGATTNAHRRTLNPVGPQYWYAAKSLSISREVHKASMSGPVPVGSLARLQILELFAYRKLPRVPNPGGEPA